MQFNPSYQTYVHFLWMEFLLGVTDFILFSDNKTCQKGNIYLKKENKHAKKSFIVLGNNLLVRYKMT